MAIIRYFLLLGVHGLSICCLGGCAAPSSGEAVRHCIYFETDQNLKIAKNVKFQYGNEVERESMTLNFLPASFFCSTMFVPEEMPISWETPDGKLHKVILPVRSRLRRSINHLTLVFSIGPNEVKGFVEESFNNRRLFVEQIDGSAIKP